MKVLNCPGAKEVIGVLVGSCKPLHKPFDLLCGGHGQQTMVEDVRLLTPTEITATFETLDTTINEHEISRGDLVEECESSATRSWSTDVRLREGIPQSFRSLPRCTSENTSKLSSIGKEESSTLSSWWQPRMPAISVPS